MDYKDTNEVLYQQLLQLRELSQEYDIKNEPELLVHISLAMVEIAKLIIFRTTGKCSLKLDGAYISKSISNSIHEAIHDTAL